VCVRDVKSCAVCTNKESTTAQRWSINKESTTASALVHQQSKLVKRK
jgi:hypothetical protein